MNLTFGKRLRELRKSKNITVTQLAALTTRQKQFISNLEHEHRLPPDEFLKTLAGLPQLDITYNELRAWIIESKYSGEQINIANTLLAESPLKKLDAFINAVPLVGRCPAGDLSKTNFSEYDDQYIYTFNNVDKNGFAVQIEGDSMKPKIEHSDIVVVEPLQDEPLKTGYIYLFRDDKNQFTCKTVKVVVKEVIVYGLNVKLWKPTALKDLKGWTVIGKVVEIIKHDNLLVTGSAFDEIDRYFNS